MASSPFLSSPNPTKTLPTSTSSLQTSFFPKTTQLSINRKLKKPFHSAPVSCKATKNGSQQNPTPSKNNGDSSLNKFDRRDVLIGLSGLYGATSLAGGDPLALAAPISAPDLTLCGDATITGSTEKVFCCPPTSERIIDFKPPRFNKIRYRPPAHQVSPQYLAKFERAMNLMQGNIPGGLSEDDPRSFKQQADVHCAYCNGAYPQATGSTKTIQVHNGWLFFPFHRLYLYFYERILGSLIGDEEFAMPYWMWDNPAGMPIPAIYNNNVNSPLYDSRRNPDHLPPKLADLNYNGTETTLSDKDLIFSNFNVMNKQVIGQRFPSLFLGQPYRAGDDNPKGAGSIEAGCHTAIHRWVGDRRDRQKNGEDMGNFYSAGKDPLFYAHHCNVDRMWNIWKNFPGPKRCDFTDPDWLNASFLFYDENKNLVRCKVSDCLDSKALGYDYQIADTPWLHTRPTPHGAKGPGGPPGRGPPGRRPGPPGRGPGGRARAAEIQSQVLRNAFPLVLDENVAKTTGVVRIEVARPKLSRSKYEKEQEEEVLRIEDIEFNSDEPIKFDVFINDEDDEVPTGPQDSQFAGTFTNIPHMGGMQMKSNLVLGISEVLEDLDVEGDETIVVTLAPREGKVTIGNIKIDYITE
ncbi:Tyrosinase [Corchorus capsularis]|uniref:Tyrosinase n=1 Tax=Corchorus capsularis TaxID=210143 RepID=A0A1R3I1N9_COCAP|nr:Tyrosinase [Corchorus capsularis]